MKHHSTCPRCSGYTRTRGSTCARCRREAPKPKSIEVFTGPPYRTRIGRGFELFGIALDYTMIAALCGISRNAVQKRESTGTSLFAPRLRTTRPVSQ